MKYPLYIRKGVVLLITWQDLIQFCMFIIALISLVIQAENSKKK